MDYKQSQRLLITRGGANLLLVPYCLAPVGRPFHLFSGLQAHSGDRKSEMGIHETSDDVWRDDKDVQFRLSNLNVSSHL